MQERTGKRKNDRKKALPDSVIIHAVPAAKCIFWGPVKPPLSLWDQNGWHDIAGTKKGCLRKWKVSLECFCHAYISSYIPTGLIGCSEKSLESRSQIVVSEARWFLPSPLGQRVALMQLMIVIGFSNSRLWESRNRVPACPVVYFNLSEMTPRAFLNVFSAISSLTTCAGDETGAAPSQRKQSQDWQSSHWWSRHRGSCTR